MHYCHQKIELKQISIIYAIDICQPILISKELFLIIKYYLIVLELSIKMTLNIIIIKHLDDNKKNMM